MNHGSGSYVGTTHKNMATHTLELTGFSLKYYIMCECMECVCGVRWCYEQGA